MITTLQRMTTASLLPSAYLAEMAARTASLWAWQMTALTRSAEAVRNGVAETPPVDLAAIEVEEAEAAEIDLVAEAVRKTEVAATANLLQAVDMATTEAAEATGTAASDIAETPTRPASDKKPFAAE